mmetsp:Transcript_33979/g.74230  ORF Transcript_33979/g.74230 Transcript_33979/m.74230 type:complete len:171 (-) Transcript_33979:280-792(-)
MGADSSTLAGSPCRSLQGPCLSRGGSTDGFYLFGGQASSLLDSDESESEESPVHQKSLLTPALQMGDGTFSEEQLSRHRDFVQRAAKAKARQRHTTMPLLSFPAQIDEDDESTQVSPHSEAWQSVGSKPGDVGALEFSGLDKGEDSEIDEDQGRSWPRSEEHIVLDMSIV